MDTIHPLEPPEPSSNGHLNMTVTTLLRSPQYTAITAALLLRHPAHPFSNASINVKICRWEN